MGAAGMAGDPLVGTMRAMENIDKSIQELIAANPGNQQLAGQLAPYLQGIREVTVQLLSSQQGPAGAAPQMPMLPPEMAPGTGIGEGQQLATGL